MHSGRQLERQLEGSCDQEVIEGHQKAIERTISGHHLRPVAEGGQEEGVGARGSCMHLRSVERR